MTNDAVTPGAPLLVTGREAARLLSVCEKSVYNMVQRGELRPVRIGAAVRFDLADLQRFVAAAKEGGR